MIARKQSIERLSIVFNFFSCYLYIMRNAVIVGRELINRASTVFAFIHVIKSQVRISKNSLLYEKQSEK